MLQQTESNFAVPPRTFRNLSDFILNDCCMVMTLSAVKPKDREILTVNGSSHQFFVTAHANNPMVDEAVVVTLPKRGEFLQARLQTFTIRVPPVSKAASENPDRGRFEVHAVQLIWKKTAHDVQPAHRPI